MSGTLAVIGVGSMGASHVRVALSTRCWDKVLVVDSDAEVARRVAEAAGMPWSTDLADVLSGVDAAVVAAPTLAHEEIATPLLAAGLPLLIEKPLTADLAGSRRLADLASGRGVPVLVGHVERFNPAVAELRRYRSEMVHLDMRRVGPSFRPFDTGVTADLMIHDLDLFLDLTADEVASVSSVMTTARPGTGEDLAAALLVSRRGVTGALMASRLGQVKHRSIIVTTAELQLVADLVAQSVRLYRLEHAEFTDANGPRYRQLGLMEIPFLEHGEPLVHEHLHFAEVAMGRREPLVSPAEAIAAIELVGRIERAAVRSGSPG